MTAACSRARWSVGICDILPRGGSAAALPSGVPSGSLPGAGRRIARPGRFRRSWGPYARARVRASEFADFSLFARSSLGVHGGR